MGYHTYLLRFLFCRCQGLYDKHRGEFQDSHEHHTNHRHDSREQVQEEEKEKKQPLSILL